MNDENTQNIEAPTPGTILREARKAKGMSLDSLSQMTRVRVVFLEAMEEDRWSDLPGRAYVLGFSKSVASALRVDEERILEALKQDFLPPSTPTRMYQGTSRRRVPKAWVFLVSLVLIGAAYGGWLYSRQVTSPEGIVRSLTPHKEPPSHKAPSPSPQKSPQVHEPAVAPAPTQASPQKKTETEAKETEAEPEKTEAEVPSTLSQPQARILLRAKEKSWVEVTAPSGAVLFSKILEPGETYQVPPRNDLMLVTGNAGGLSVLVDGELLPPLGSEGAVLRHLKLDPDSMKKGKVRATPQN